MEQLSFESMIRGQIIDNSKMQVDSALRLDDSGLRKVSHLRWMSFYSLIQTKHRETKYYTWQSFKPVGFSTAL